MSANKHYDLMSSEFISNPYPTYAEIQADEPVLQVNERHWLVTGYAEAKMVLADHKRFVKDYRNAVSPEAQVQKPALIEEILYRNMLALDPPDHTRLRNIVGKAFTQQRIAALAPRIQEIADELVDAFPKNGPFDLIDAYAFPLPIIVICELLGIPAEDRDKFRVWSNAFIDGSTNYNQHMLDFLDYLTRTLHEKRATPQPDLISDLIHAEIDGETLTEQQLYSMIILLIVAGHETTVNLIGNGVLALLQHPDQMTQLRENPDLTEGAIEEFLRYDSPVERATDRYASEDVELGGHLIKQGSYIQLALGAANRDPELADEPANLDILRVASKHLGFGYGIHYCLGAPLARLEGKIAVNTLLQRMPHLQLAVTPDKLKYRHSMVVRGLSSLPVTST